MKFLQYLHIDSPVKAILLGGFMVVLIGLIDYQLNSYLSLSIFYLVPVYLVTWHVGRGAGIVCTVVSCLSWFIANRQEYSPQVPAMVHYWNTGVIFGFLGAFCYLLSELKGSLEREKRLSRTDYLTKVANNKFFFELADLEIKRARRYRYLLTIAYIDVDNFTSINQQFGGKTGDRLLKVTATTIKNQTRVTDIIARLGGDEFAILLPETAYEPAQIVLKRLQKALEDEMAQHQWRVTFSIAAVTFIKPPDSVEGLIERADNLMYYVKHNGKNTIKHERFGD